MRQIQDGFFRQAKREGYFARSVYKLKAIQEKFRLFGPGDAVLDLGSAPGSWIQYIREVVGPDAPVAGVDLGPVKPSIRRKAQVLQRDIAACGPADFAPVAERFDAVVSDMAPATSGVKLADQAGSLELCRLAWGLAAEVLAPGGAFVCKIFESPHVQGFVDELRPRFQAVRRFKPPASRNESTETFIVACGFGRASAPKATRPAPRKRRKRGRKGGSY